MSRYLIANLEVKIKGKWKFGGECCSLVGRTKGRQHTGKNAAKFKMKFILKQYEQKACYTCIYLDFVAISYQKIIIFIFVQIKNSKFLLINIFVRRTHGN